jgi:glycosyltransferase involved in cell wall biosynthesis
VGVSEERRYDFVVFSDDWGRHASSCQHLFSRIGLEHRVLWVNTIGLRAPKTDGFTLFRGMEKIRSWMKPLQEVSKDFCVLSPVMLPVFGEGFVAGVNRAMVVRAIRGAMRKMGMRRPILWTTVPTAVDYVGKLDESAVVYYVTDDYHLWPGGNAGKIIQADRALTQKSDLIFACSEPLEKSHRNTKNRTVLLPHAVDFEHFSMVRPEPAELEKIPRPRACFFGLIYEKIDLESLRELATARPGIQLVMIGPVGTDVSRLEGLSNVHFLGAKPYAELPAYLQAMDCFAVPYVPDEEIKASGPLKIRECLAVGKPVVVRALPDLESLGDVAELYRKREYFVLAVDRAMGDGRVQERQERVRGETWESRVATIERELAGVIGKGN